MAHPQEFIVTLRNLKEDHQRLFSEHKVLTGMLRDVQNGLDTAIDNQAVITDNQAVIREGIDALERKLDEVVALIRQIRAL